MSSSSSKPSGLPERPEPIGPPPVGSGLKSLAFWVVLAAFALGLLLIIAQRPERSERPGGNADPLVGRHLEDLNLAPLTGDPAQLSLQDLNGKVTLVNFWGTWCPPCLMEFPHLDTLRKDLAKHEDFRFASVSCLSGIETNINALRSDTESFLRGRGSDLPTYYDPDGTTRIAIMDAAGNAGFGYPMTLLFDRNGDIRGVWRGYAPGMEKEMRKVTEEVLAGK